MYVNRWGPKEAVNNPSHRSWAARVYILKVITLYAVSDSRWRQQLGRCSRCLRKCGPVNSDQIRLHLDPGDLVEMSFQLTEKDIEDFQRDGAVCLRGVFSAEWLEKARVGIEKTLAKPSQYR